MQTSEFVAGLTELLALAGEARVAIMCAEALPWRCHRSLIADALMVRGVRVVDLLNRTSAREHRLTSFARATGAHLVYPAIEGAPGANGASIGPDPPPPPACGPIVAAGLLSRRGVS